MPAVPRRRARRGDEATADLASAHADAALVVQQLPESLRFGTSSWSFPGWAGLVYPSSASSTTLAREGLRHYARHPLLRTVGVDRSYYAPVPVADLRAYADQLPEGFPCCFKAPAAVTSQVPPAFGGPRPRGANPDFLSVDRLCRDLLEPLDLAFRAHTGPLLLEFPPPPSRGALTPPAFLDALDGFLRALPSGFSYAVEVRDRRLLTSEYRALLATYGVAHVYNYWSAMPLPAEQAATLPPEEQPFTVVRLLLRPGTAYESQKDAFQPFNRLVEPDEAMRDDVEAVTMAALGAGRRVYVLVNNKAEGSSPLTVRALAERLAARLSPHRG